MGQTATRVDAAWPRAAASSLIFDLLSIFASTRFQNNLCSLQIKLLLTCPLHVLFQTLYVRLGRRVTRRTAICVPWAISSQRTTTLSVTGTARRVDHAPCPWTTGPCAVRSRGRALWRVVSPGAGVTKQANTPNQEAGVSGHFS